MLRSVEASCTFDDLLVFTLGSDSFLWWTNCSGRLDSCSSTRSNWLRGCTQGKMHISELLVLWWTFLWPTVALLKCVFFTQQSIVSTFTWWLNKFLRCEIYKYSRKYAPPFPAVFLPKITSTEAICCFTFSAALSTKTQRRPWFWKSAVVLKV